MTFKEENIVNIAMRAAELLKDGRIERNDIAGHVGLTDTIIDLADAFEKQNAGVDFNAGDRDYWEEIDSFAEVQLLKEYGIEQAKTEKPLDIKVIFDRGILSDVLINQNQPVNVELVDVDPNYEDYDKLCAYRNDLYADKSFQECEYTVVHFDDEEPELSSDEFVPEPVTVFAHSGGGTSFALMSGNYDECLAFCQSNNWEYVDENRFDWGLTLDDEREVDFPNGFYAAVKMYSREEGKDVDSEFVRQNADKLVAAQLCGLSFSDFKSWGQLESFLGEKVTADEFNFIKQHFDIASLSDPAYSPFAKEMKDRLAEYREDISVRNPSKASLNDIISKASQKQSSLDAPSQPKDYSRDI